MQSIRKVYTINWRNVYLLTSLKPLFFHGCFFIKNVQKEWTAQSSQCSYIQRENGHTRRTERREGENCHTLHEHSILKQAVKTSYISYPNKPIDSFTKQLIKQPAIGSFVSFRGIQKDKA